MKVLKLFRSWTAAILIAASVFLAAGLIFQAKPQLNSGTTLQLAPPAFVKSVQAQSGIDISAKLDAEAGISAYYKSPMPILLSQVRPIFRVIELETPDYIIGSVPITGFEEHFDAHVYVHKDGWILAYYMVNEPSSKILDPFHKTISTTKLKMAIGAVAGLAGAPFTDVTYYDFRYPNAKYILLVMEDDLNGTDFKITLPGTYAYYERGWASAATCSNSYYADFNLNGVNLIGSRTYGDTPNAYGSISASQLGADTAHSISTASACPYAILMITYWKP